MKYGNLFRAQFDSARKRMSTVIEVDGQRRLCIKGASEIILETCTHYLAEDGTRTPLDDTMRSNLTAQITSFAQEALRTIGLAYKDLAHNEGGERHEEKRDGSKIHVIEEGGLTLVSIVGIQDIIREEVPKAVIDCNQAGVRVRMVTGDNKVTAIAIAKQCGIIQPGEDQNPNVC